MRQLNQTGYLNNRMRLIVASFLIKNLHISWQKGAQWFLDHLIDADFSNNSAAWQWSADTGYSRPIPRILNPEVQMYQWDPYLEYTKLWLQDELVIKNYKVISYIHKPIVHFEETKNQYIENIKKEK
jgi:deoxyribodipyrimidine photo-lyase